MATPNQSPPTTVSPDAEALARSFAEITQQSQRVVNEYLARARDGKAALPTDDLGLTTAFMDLSASLMANPWKLAELQMRMWHDYFRLWHSSMQRFLGEQPAPVVEPAKSDNRFKNEVWENNFLFDYIKQSYLIAAQNIQQTVSEAEGLPDQTARKVRFFTRQFVDALSPTNFVFTNPEVLHATIDSGGKNLIDGLQNLLTDLERGKGQLAISMTDYQAFELGRNVATAPGKVVYQTDLMQLIQYDPSTPQVWRTPLLIIPPWINKYYILDLREKNSFIRWAVSQGHTVFMVSWVNPDDRYAGKSFDDYMLEGPLAALDAIEQATGEREANVIGYCLGGTLLACLLAWLAAKGQQRVKSATFFTAMIDFREPGELGVFVDDTAVSNLEKKMAERGYLEGSEMANTFNLLRANDLIWSFVVNNYLLGKDPFPFDLLYWNSDSTRMPAKMHTFYLRNMYIKNLLVEPGGIALAGEPIDVTRVTTPACFVSTIEDHIAPWKSTYMGARLLGGPVKFLLAGSGHIAGVVNPPAAQKYCHWTDSSLPETADEWLAGAQRHDGSWWPEWNAWVSGHGGDKVPARVPGDGKLKVLEDAPGSYVKLRLDPAASEVPPSGAPPANSPPTTGSAAADGTQPSEPSRSARTRQPGAPAKSRRSG
ncbi:MAG TPA: class I poly(R)-hydroxyalkanoic acid synthase [Burkholderiales bacterium]|nr:class I poly(R)-hydroxyalkanoic acid synthase [Burkholderiales bacterium]